MRTIGGIGRRVPVHVEDLAPRLQKCLGFSAVTSTKWRLRAPARVIEWRKQSQKLLLLHGETSAQLTSISTRTVHTHDGLMIYSLAPITDALLPYTHAGNCSQLIYAVACRTIWR